MMRGQAGQRCDVKNKLTVSLPCVVVVRKWEDEVTRAFHVPSGSGVANALYDDDDDDDHSGLGMSSADIVSLLRAGVSTNERLVILVQESMATASGTAFVADIYAQ